jgi:hypothetical protein
MTVLNASVLPHSSTFSFAQVLVSRGARRGTALAKEGSRTETTMNTARKLCSFLLIATAAGLLAVCARS